MKNYNIAVKTRGGGYHLPTEDHPRRRRPQLRHRGGPFGGSAVHGSQSGQEDPPPTGGRSRAAAPAVQAQEDQVSLTALSEGEVMDQLRRTQVDTLSPLEALNLLYELKKKLS